MAFNKMFVMLPVMLAARKLDGEDPNIVFLLRCIYGGVQTIAFLLVLFVYRQASAAAADATNDVTIYVPPPPQVSASEISVDIFNPLCAATSFDVVPDTCTNFHNGQRICVPSSLPHASHSKTPMQKNHTKRNDYRASFSPVRAVCLARHYSACA